MGIVSFTFNPTNPQWEGLSGLRLESKVRDPLHDTIPFTKAEKWIIDRPEFQRLRKIQQTAFIKYVFPGATHTRFEHSLGVMHLSGVLWSRLYQNQLRLLKSVETDLEGIPSLLRSGYDLASEVHGSLSETKGVLGVFNDPKILQTLRFAALLHDIGHAPFSHSAERFMPTWLGLEAQLPELDLCAYLKEALGRKVARYRQTNPGLLNKRIRHEVFTLMIVARLFHQESEFLDSEMGQNVCSVIDLDVCPVGVLAESGLRSLMHEVVSGELDVDRMDYLMRDSRECGVVYGLFDAGRLLDSAGFYFQPSSKSYHLALRKSGVAAFEDYLRARWSMYQQVYFHKTSTACEAMLESLRKSCKTYTLPLRLDEYLKLNDHTFPSVLRLESEKVSETESGAAQLCDDLFDTRRLWKRVYEESVPQSMVNQVPSLCPAVVALLNQKNIKNEMIESRTNLTRFSPKGRGSHTQNTLRVIVKDIHGFVYLEPIENHSPLVNQTAEENSIRRIFVGLDEQSEHSLLSLRQEISRSMTMPELEQGL